MVKREKKNGHRVSASWERGFQPGMLPLLKKKEGPLGGEERKGDHPSLGEKERGPVTEVVPLWQKRGQEEKDGSSWRRKKAS